MHSAAITFILEERRSAQGTETVQYLRLQSHHLLCPAQIPPPQCPLDVAQPRQVWPLRHYRRQARAEAVIELRDALGRSEDAVGRPPEVLRRQPDFFWS